MSSLSRETEQKLQRIFLEGKWLYNAILASGEIGRFKTSVRSVPVKVMDEMEDRKLENISSQMKQGLQARMFSSLATLKTRKERGFKVGQLKFKSDINSIPLKQHNNTFTILKKQKRIKLQGFKKPLKVNGLNQLPKDYEVGNANLVKVGNDFYFKITIFTPVEKVSVPNQSVGIDFGCTTQLTLSNGDKIAYQVPVGKRIRKLDRSLARKVKRSKNHFKILGRRQKAYLNLTNKRKEIKNQIASKLVKSYSTICFQDESIAAWAASGHGKKIQFSAMGGIISALQRKAVTPVVVRKHYPSTQLCSRCGNKQKMEQWERTYVCQSCGSSIDRDVNSAINIEQEGLRILTIPTERRESKPVEMEASASCVGFADAIASPVAEAGSPRL
jgi:transposase